MRVMSQAAQAAGGIENLAKRLGGFSPLTVQGFIDGTVRPPEDVFFRAYAVIHNEDLPRDVAPPGEDGPKVPGS